MTTSPDALCGISITAKGNDTAEILVYDQIGRDSWTGEGLTAKAFAEQLQKHGKVKNINLRINSPGGSVYDGMAIYNTLKNHPPKVTATVDGIAASAASLIAMAADDLRMAKNGFLMIHEPHGVARGDSEEMRRMASLLETMTAQFVATYAERSKQPPEKIAEMLKAETYLTATEAKELGFIDSIANDQAIAAKFDSQLFAKAPDEFLALINKPEPLPKEKPKMSDENKVQPATIAEIKASCEGASSEFILAQVEAGATLAQAITAHAKVLHAKLVAEAEQHAKQIENAKKAHEVEMAELKAKLEKPGVKPVASGEQVEGDDSDPVTAYEAKLIEAKKSLPADKAAAKVARENPELRAAYIEAVNARRSR